MILDKRNFHGAQGGSSASSHRNYGALPRIKVPISLVYMKKNRITRILYLLKSRLTDELGDRLVKMVLYGSRARGDYRGDSDIDVAIIVRGLTGALKNRLLEIIADIEIEYLTALSTLVISEETFESLKKRERRLALDIETEGLLI